MSNTSGVQENNTQMILANTSPIIKSETRTNKVFAEMRETGNDYWLATRNTGANYDSKGGKVDYSEDIAYESYCMSYIKTDGAYGLNVLFQINGYVTSFSNKTLNCAMRPVITVSADSVSDKTIGATVKTDPFYKGKTGDEAHGYVKADSIASLLGVDIKAINKVNSGLPTMETDMTWTKLTDGGYDALTGSFDKKIMIII